MANVSSTVRSRSVIEKTKCSLIHWRSKPIRYLCSLSVTNWQSMPAARQTWRRSIEPLRRIVGVTTFRGVIAVTTTGT